MRLLLLPLKAIGSLYKWMWRIPRLIGLILIIVVTLSPIAAYVGVDATTRLALSSEPIVQSYEGTGTKTDRIVYLGGAGSAPSAQVADMLDTLKTEAKNVDVIEFARDKFLVPKIVNLVIQRVAGDHNVTFVGASLGGLLAHDTIKKLRDSGDTRKFGVVLIDAPASGDDVTGIPGVLKAFSWVPVGAITNLWHDVPFDRHAPATIDPNANKQNLETLWRSYETWKTSCWIDQGRYVFLHDPIVKLLGVSWYFIRSAADDFVSKDAQSHWQDVQGAINGSSIPEGKHIALLNRPALYNAEMQKGLTAVAQ